MTPKRVLILNGVMPPPYGGIAKYLGVTLPELAQKGYHITAYTQKGYPLTKNFESVSNLSVENAGNPGGYLNLLRVCFLYLPFILERVFRWKAPLLETILTLNRWFPEADKRTAELKPDLIHVYDAPWSQGWIGYILSKKHNIPLVITTFGEVLPHKDELALIDAHSEKYRLTSKAILQHCQRISAPTNYCSTKLGELQIDYSKAWLTYHVVDTDQYADRNQNSDELFYHAFPQAKGKKVVLFIGQLLARKGPEVLARAMKEVHAAHHDAFCLFIGPDLGFGPMLKKEIAQLGIEDVCHIAGPVSEELLTAAYHHAYCFCFTTVSHIECLGLVFVQAMCAGVPVVASRISGVPEVIDHGDNGLLFEPGNHQQLAEGIHSLLGDESYANTLAQKGQQRALTQFPLDRILHQIEEFYQLPQ